MSWHRSREDLIASTDDRSGNAWVAPEIAVYALARNPGSHAEPVLTAFRQTFSRESRRLPERPVEIPRARNGRSVVLPPSAPAPAPATSPASNRRVSRYRQEGRPEPWIRARLDGQADRGALTSTLARYGCRIESGCNPYLEATRALTMAAVGRLPSEVRAERSGEGTRAETRDLLTEHELAQLRFAESAATRLIVETGAYGNARVMARVADAAEIVTRARLELEQRIAGVVARSGRDD